MRTATRAVSAASTPVRPATAPPRPALATRLALTAATVAALTAAGAAPAFAAAAADALNDGSHHVTAASHTPLLVVTSLAEGESFWANLGRYASYYFSVLLGTAATATGPVIAALKRPKSAAIVVVVGGAVLYGVSRTVAAMLDLGDTTAADDLAAFLQQ